MSEQKLSELLERLVNFDKEPLVLSQLDDLPDVARVLEADRKRLEALERVEKVCLEIMNEAPRQDASEVPDWLDTLLGKLSLTLPPV